MCVESLASYRPVPLTAAIDLRTQLAPDSTSHVQEIGYLAFLATCLIAKRDTQAVLAFPQASAFYISRIRMRRTAFFGNLLFRCAGAPICLSWMSAVTIMDGDSTSVWTAGIR